MLINFFGKHRTFHSTQYNDNFNIHTLKIDGHIIELESIDNASALYYYQNLVLSLKASTSTYDQNTQTLTLPYAYTYDAATQTIILTEEVN